MLNSQKIAPDAKRILISRNPKSGSGNRYQLVVSLADALRAEGFEVDIIEDIGQLEQAVHDSLADNSLRTVVSAGGDGTVSLLVNRLPPQVPYTVFPLGTANLLAKYLDATSSAAAVVETIKHGDSIGLDVGQANDKLFIVVASCGYDADVVARLHKARTGHINYLSYARPMLESVFKYKFPQMRMIADGKELRPARWAFVLNLPRYALGLAIIPDSNGHDGKLDVCAFSKGGLLRGLYYFFAVVFRRHQNIADTEFAAFETLELESLEPGVEVPIELDGDPAGVLPVTIKVLPQRLRVLVSEQWLAKQKA